MLKTTTVQLDLYSKQNYVYIQAQQYDQNSRYLALCLTDCGDPYEIPANTKAIIVMNKPDNTSVINDCSITDNMVMIELTQQMLIASGLGTARVTLHDNATNAALSSVDFYVRIQPCPVGQSVIASSNEYQTFIDALNRLDSIIADGSQLIIDVNILKKDLELIKEDALQLIIDTTIAKDDAIKATNDAIDATNAANEEEKKRQANETIRVNSEDIRISSEETRMSNESERESAETVRKDSEDIRVKTEADRVLAEANRSTAEDNRVISEDNREVAETSRVEVETIRVTNEITRQENEEVRGVSEQQRIINETNRDTKESERITSETNRTEAETNRETNETNRINTETSRVNAETTRDTTEKERISNETQRIESETNRGTAEANRINSETDRTTAESTREENEIERQKAEQKRQTDTTTAIKNADKATDRANIAAEACEDIVDKTGLIPNTEKGRAGGVATLDENVKLPLSQLTTHSHEFTTLTNKPTTLTGYGITDALSSSDTNFTPAATRSNIISGETLKSILGKINTWFGDLKTLAFKDKIAIGDLENNLISHNLTTNNTSMVLGADQGVAIQEQLAELDDKKVDTVIGKGLSTNDYTTPEKTKLSQIADSANNYVHPDTHPASIIIQDADNRFITDIERTNWNKKPQPKALTIPNTSWIDSIGTGAYKKKIEIEESDIKADDNIILNIVLESENIAQDCGLSFGGETVVGKIILYAESEPVNNINCNYIII